MVLQNESISVEFSHSMHNICGDLSIFVRQHIWFNSVDVVFMFIF